MCCMCRQMRNESKTNRKLIFLVLVRELSVLTLGNELQAAAWSLGYGGSISCINSM